MFDIYERSTGGNAIFHLNVPPNREGKISQRDIEVLKEVGKRIKQTYGTNLLGNVKGNEVFFDGRESYAVIKGKTINFETMEPITINRLVIQESIKTHGERVAKFHLQAWVHGKWDTVASATNIGHKRILRFPEITAKRFKIHIGKSRAIPAIKAISAHYYREQMPLLYIQRDSEGVVTITPKRYTFNWNDQRK